MSRDARESRRTLHRLNRLMQFSAGLMTLLLIVDVVLQVNVPNLLINALALSLLVTIAVGVYIHVKLRTRRPAHERGKVVTFGEHTYRAYTGLGVVLASILSIPAAAIGFLVFIYLLATSVRLELAAAAGWMVYIGWFGFCLYSFTPVTIEVLQTGVLSWFPRLRSGPTLMPWSSYKARHLIGPLFYVPPLRALPLSVFIVRRSREFRRDLVTRGQKPS